MNAAAVVYVVHHFEGDSDAFYRAVHDDPVDAERDSRDDGGGSIHKYAYVGEVTITSKTTTRVRLKDGE